MTLFETVYGRKPPSLVRVLQGETRVEVVEAELMDRDEALHQLKHHLSHAQELMRKYANQKRRDMSFEVGEWVFLKLRPHRQVSVAKRNNPKLAPRFFGPFPILERVGAVSYKLKLPEGARVHLVFHVSQLKKAVGNYSVEAVLPAGLELELEENEEREELLASREIFEGEQPIKQWLVKWKGRATEDTTWEDETLLRSQFPTLRLEDKAVSSRGSNDRELVHKGEFPNYKEKHKDTLWKVYTRRKKIESRGES